MKSLFGNGGVPTSYLKVASFSGSVYDLYYIFLPSLCFAAVTPSSSVIVTAPNSTAAVLPVATSSGTQL